MTILVGSYMGFPFSIGQKKGDYMIHDWTKVYVDTNTQKLGKFVILKFVDDNGEEHEYRLRGSNVKWLRKALKRGSKLAKMGDDL